MAEAPTTKDKLLLMNYQLELDRQQRTNAVLLSKLKVERVNRKRNIEIEQKRRKKKRSIWVRQWLTRRQELGQYTRLMNVSSSSSSDEDTFFLLLFAFLDITGTLLALLLPLFFAGMMIARWQLQNYVDVAPSKARSQVKFTPKTVGLYTFRSVRDASGTQPG